MSFSLLRCQTNAFYLSTSSSLAEQRKFILKSKKAVAHFHSKRVIEQDIFTPRADYRDGAAENLIDSGGLKGSLSGYDSLQTCARTCTRASNDLFSLFKWQQRRESSSTYGSCPHLVCRHLFNLLVYRPTPKAHQFLTIRSKHTPAKPTQEIILTLITREC